jgi:hypothetical protein
MLGEKIKTLYDADNDAGVYDLTISANDLLTGVYVLTMNAGGWLKSEKLVVVK